MIDRILKALNAWIDRRNDLNGMRDSLAAICEWTR